MSIRDWLAPSGRAEQAGMFLAGATVPLTLQRTLMPRVDVVITDRYLEMVEMLDGS